MLAEGAIAGAGRSAAQEYLVTTKHLDGTIRDLRRVRIQAIRRAQGADHPRWPLPHATEALPCHLLDTSRCL
jgi:hypothetical protein